MSDCPAVVTADGAHHNDAPGAGDTARGHGPNPGANGASGTTTTPFDQAKAAMQPFIDRNSDNDPEWDRPSVLAQADLVAKQHKVRPKDLRACVTGRLDSLDAAASTAREKLEAEAAPDTADDSAFDRAKAAMQPFIDRFAEGELDEASLLATADEIAARYKVRKNDLRRWAKQEMDKARVKPAQPSEPEDVQIADLPDPPASPQPQSLTMALDQIVRLIRHRIVCAVEVAWAGALWTAATWGVCIADGTTGAELFPRLTIGSATKRCGKSMLLEIVAAISSRPISASNVTPAAVFRVLERGRLTWCLDEVDRFVGNNNQELIGVINSGYKTTGAVIRLVDVTTRGANGKLVKTFKPCRFPTFSPMALAGIGRSIDTIEDRAVRILLTRQPAPHAPSKRVRLGELKTAREVICPHLRAHGDAMATAMAGRGDDADFPSWLNDRDADNWHPLIAVAKLAGGDWPVRVQLAMRALCLGEERAAQRTPGERLLADIHTYVQERRREAVDEYITRRSARQSALQTPPAGPATGGGSPVSGTMPTAAAAAAALAAVNLTPSAAPQVAVAALIAAGTPAADAALVVVAVRTPQPRHIAIMPSGGLVRPGVLSFIASYALAQWLMQVDDCPISKARDSNHAKNEVARLLRRFGIKPEQRKLSGESVRGYSIPQFRSLWRRYGIGIAVP